MSHRQIFQRFHRGRLAGIVDDLLHDTTEVAMALGVIEVAELGGGLVQARVGSCYRRLAIVAIIVVTQSGSISKSFRDRGVGRLLGETD